MVLRKNSFVCTCIYDIHDITQAIIICKNLELWEDLVRCFSAQGSLFFRQGDTAKALARYDEALKIAERLEQKVRISFDLLSSKADVSIFYFPDSTLTIN